MKVHLQEVEFGYSPGQTLFRIEDLEIDSGTSVGIIGPSGIGKTSLLRLLGGIALPTHGQVWMGETNLSAQGEAQRRRFRNERIGLVFQDFRLLEYLSIRDNMLLPFYVGGRSSEKADWKERAAGLVGQLELTHRIHAAPSKLSQGEQQRVAIGRALVSSPQLVLADEPTGNLDERNKGRVRDLLLNYCCQQKATLVMVTHEPHLLEPFDQVIDFSRFQLKESVR